MLIKVFIESAGNFEERELLMKFFQGIKKVQSDNHKIKFQPYDTNGVFLDFNPAYTDCDVAVMMGSWKNRDRDHHAVRNSIVDNARCFVVVETPLLQRKMFQRSEQHRIGVNGFLNNQGVFTQNNCNNTRKNKLDIEWDGWKNDPDGHILLMLQLPGDASMRNVSTYQWALKTIERLREYTQRPILVRSHPSHKPKEGDEFYKFFYDIMNTENVKFSLGSKTTVEEDLKKAYCTVAFSSGSSIDSIIAGVPVLAQDPGNFAFELSSNYISDIENLKLAEEKEVNNWLNQLAYSQWSPEEMENGVAWMNLLPIVDQVLSVVPAPMKKKK